MVEFTEKKRTINSTLPTYLQFTDEEYWAVSTHKMGLSKRFIGKQNTSYAVRFKTKESIEKH